MRGRRRPTTAIEVSRTTRPIALVVVVAVVHPQGPPIELELVQISDRRRRCVYVCVLQEAEAFGSAGLLVVYEAEVDNLSGAAEDFADLFFTYACGCFVSCCRKQARPRCTDRMGCCR
jgi:hypothetical protein